ncbi:hypothetical protein HY78_13475 [Rhizorhabdus wittichii DC-6]|uniref:hypothetical protein n=1 Tax=Rhizorhabdus wittichii TaxID=160791 RepID=UPI000326A25B|nr:hypothetical protein [Rhizorhabdus wittichii]ARR54366.1 hypothetical protein HY78_13475 [Rhizorhabdus wittichii DC-6]
MNNGGHRGMRWSLSILAGVAAAVASAPAQSATTRFTLETDYRLGYDTNPFLSAGSDLSATYIETSIAPKLVRQSEKGQVALSGHFDRTGYLEHYGKADSYGAELEMQQRLSPKLNAFAALRYDSSIIGQGDDGVTGNPIDNPDVNLIGLRRRADIFSASGGFEYQVGPKDSISVDGGYTATRYRNGPPGNDSDNYGGRVGWKHAISSRSKIGISGSIYKIDYDTPGLSTLIMQPSVTFSSQLSPTWTVDASLGVSFSDLSLPFTVPGASRSASTTGLSGSLQLCHAGVKDQFCFFGDRSVSASGAGGTVEQTQLGVNYRRQMTERVGVSWTGSYVRSKSQSTLLGGTRQFVTGVAGVDWRVFRSLTVGAQGRYRDVYGAGLPIKADIGGEVFARLQLTGR